MTDNPNLAPEKFYFKDSLYNYIEISKIDYENVFNLINNYCSIDSFCPYCQEKSIFTNKPHYRTNNPTRGENTYVEKLYKYSKENIFKVHNITFSCTRKTYGHTVVFYVKVEKDRVFKIGQFPSLADLSEYFKNKKYHTVLDKVSIHEFNKAIGLASSGIGIGSFVYLRRIFEKLIIYAKEEAKSNIKNWDEDKFSDLRMNDKIAFLKEYLPEFLVHNSSIYGILSKGIHELEEKECLSLFPVIKSGIEHILDWILRTKLTPQKQLQN